MFNIPNAVPQCSDNARAPASRHRQKIYHDSAQSARTISRGLGPLEPGVKDGGENQPLDEIDDGTCRLELFLRVVGRFLRHLLKNHSRC